MSITNLKIKSAYYTFLNTVEDSSTTSNIYTGEGHVYDTELNFNQIANSMHNAKGLVLTTGNRVRSTPLMGIIISGSRVFGVNKLGNLQWEEQDELPPAPSSTSGSIAFASNSLWYYGEI